MAYAHPDSASFTRLMEQVESGHIKIPQFQRDFVWSKADSAKLIDSVIKGYPIGTFILWNTGERMRTVRNIGDLPLRETPMGQFTLQVLDGQQRLTSLFASARGAVIQREGRSERFDTIGIDLTADPTSDQPVVLPERPEGRADDAWVSLMDLLGGGMALASRYPQSLHTRLDTYARTFLQTQFSVVTVHNAPIEVATEIFTRLNVGGTRLTTCMLASRPS